MPELIPITENIGTEVRGIDVTGRISDNEFERIYRVIDKVGALDGPVLVAEPDVVIAGLEELRLASMSPVEFVQERIRVR
ncbi:hypothetical protein [Microbispora amethystogenes]|uniref:hypothetical protein n=1 Tax=Microbispora amethystogenes TaxID=1427754 RepID=UPI001954F3E3|nr:hypothetical protein [Microbispora amethystogenes]